MKFKRITTFILSLVMLIGMIPVDSVYAGADLIDKTNKDRTEWDGKTDWTRPYDENMGIDPKTGKNVYTTNPGGPGFGDSYTYRQWMAIMLNWAGIKYLPEEEGKGVDKKTGETAFRESRIMYDVFVEQPNGEVKAFSGFGFKGRPMYKHLLNAENKDKKIEEIDCSKFFSVKKIVG